MIANEIIYKVRLYVGDATKSVFSDFEIIASINDALRLLAEQSAQARNAMFKKEAVLEPDRGVVELPVDYVGVIKALDSDGAELLNVHVDAVGTGEFKIDGGYLISGESRVFLIYYSTPTPIVDNADDVNIPATLSSVIARVASLLLRGNFGDANSIAGYFVGKKE